MLKKLACGAAARMAYKPRRCEHRRQEATPERSPPPPGSDGLCGDPTCTNTAMLSEAREKPRHDDLVLFAAKAKTARHCLIHHVRPDPGATEATPQRADA